jgi:hypothetical protein
LNWCHVSISYHLPLTLEAAAVPLPILNGPVIDPDVPLDTQPNNGTSSPRSSTSPAPMAPEDQRNRIQIEIEYHPHSGKARTIIPLDSTRSGGGESTSTRLRRQLVPAGRPPWAPFPSRADFEWAETMYMMPNDNITAQLKGMHSNWCDNSHVKIKTVDELKMYLQRAKHYVVEVSFFPTFLTFVEVISSSMSTNSRRLLKVNSGISDFSIGIHGTG